MRMIAQYYEPDAGVIRLDGVPVGEAGRQAKWRIGFLPENNPLYDEMLTSEYLDFMARLRELRGADATRAIHEAVEATGIGPVYNRPIGELSKGFRQRVGLATAILHRPDLLVLDEPTEGLDPNQRVEIRRLIASLGRERTVILSTHVLPEVQHTCSRVVIINRGRIAADGTVDVLVNRASQGARVHVELSGVDVVPELRALDGVRSVRQNPDPASGITSVELDVSGDTDIRPVIFQLARDNNWTLYELHRETGSLEDLFRDLTADETAPPEAAA
jgi:ABC-2 type transport system ATP-binding protein